MDIESTEELLGRHALAESRPNPNCAWRAAMPAGLSGTSQPAIESPILRSMTKAEFALEESRFKDTRDALQQRDRSALTERHYWAAVVF